jgi:type IV pilus assembly protein PilF
MNYFKPILCFVFTMLIGCTSQSSGPKMGDDFDQQKAAKTRVSLGLTYLKNGNYSQAKFNLDKALEFAPRSADAHFGLAYYYQTVGEVNAAERSYQTAMDYEPRNADIANSYGAFLCQQGKYPMAKEYFFKAINSSNYISSAETYENLALCSQRLGYQAETTEYLRSAVNHQPGRSKSLLLLTQSLIREEKWLDARDFLRKYEKVSQISPESLLLSTQIEQALGNEQIAAGYGDMLLMMFPDSTASKTYKERLAGVVKPVMRKSLKTLPVDESSGQNEKQFLVTNAEPVEDVDEFVETVVETSEQANTVKAQTQQAESVTTEELDTVVAIEPSFHVVTDGENLYRISLRYNIKMQRLLEWNNLSNASDIFAGKKLRLMAPDTARE